jgi:hypothetical protein
MDNVADLKVSILEMGPFGMMFRRCDFRIGYYDSDIHFDVFRAPLILNQDLQDYQDER